MNTKQTFHRFRSKFRWQLLFLLIINLIVGGVSINLNRYLRSSVDSSSSDPSSSDKSSSTDISPIERMLLKRMCRQLHKKHKVNPGESWGTMDKSQQDEWISWNCDQFFCQPHQLAGKGIYKCVPLVKNNKPKNEEDENTLK